MLITEILELTTGSIDMGDVDDYSSPEAFWQTLINTKAADTGFGHLVDDILANGWREGSYVGWEDGNINEGHHRLVAAILLCWDEIPTSPHGGDIYKNGVCGRDLINSHECYEDPAPIYLVD